MVANDEGMTRIYNHFHDVYESEPRIERLRELHAAMDRAVLEAYGWGDVPTDCEFLLDYADRRTPPGVERRNPIASAGRTPYATRSSPASLPSTPNARLARPVRTPAYYNVIDYLSQDLEE